MVFMEKPRSLKLRIGTPVPGPVLSARAEEKPPEVPVVRPKSNEPGQKSIPSDMSLVDEELLKGEKVIFRTGMHWMALLTETQRQSIENILEESDSLRIFLMRHIVRTDEKENLTVDEIVSAYLGFCVRQQWIPMAAGQVQRRLEPLMLEFFAAALDRHIEREGKDQRGFRHVRWQGDDEADPLENPCH